MTNDNHLSLFLLKIGDIMDKIFISKTFIIILVYTICLPIMAYLIFKIIKSNDKNARKKIALIVAIIGSIIFSKSLEYNIDKIPFQTKKIEKAFRFNYSKKYSLVFKQKYNNTYFLYGKSMDENSPFDECSCYYNTKNGWRILIQPSNQYTGRINTGGYEIFYCSNKKDKVTGIFVAKIVQGHELDKSTKITDKYRTKYTYITDKNKKPISYNYSKSYVYFATLNKVISKDYYIKVNGDKIKFTE